MYRKQLMWIIAVVFLSMQGCSANNSNDPVSGSSDNPGKGTLSVSLTDAPAYGFDHVWITVRDLWFHTSDSAETEQAGWVKFPLASPVTLDLLELGNGNVSLPVWDDLELPEGDYTQIRLFLVKTENTLAGPAAAAGLTYNNQVDVTNDAAPYPLRVPDAMRGIQLTGTFQVRKNEKLKLAIDFDAGDDVVKVEHDNKTEYILKPRLAYFDLDNAGAIVGSIDTAATASNPSAQFVFKAEQVGPNGLLYTVRRVTALADRTGKFVLFPLAPGAYDLVMRGINYETVIIKGVPVVKGTTPQSQPTVIPAITMTAATVPDYAVKANITSPTGAWVDFSQTLPGAGKVPYGIRFRHFNPMTGQFAGFLLSSGPIQVGTYDASSITLSPITPVEGNGGYKAIAGAPLHNLSSFVTVTPSANTLSFGTLSVASPATGRGVSGTIMLPETFAPGTGLDRGVLFAVHGGMIVNAIKVDSQMASGGAYTMGNLPGGTLRNPLPRAFYGIEAMGWSSSSPETRASSHPKFVDLSAADATGIDLNMVLLP